MKEFKKPLPETLKAYQFKKGQSGNPLGGRLASGLSRQLRSLTLESYKEIIKLVMSGSVEALKEKAQDPKATALEVGIITSTLKAIKTGDYETLEKIVSRVVGKIPDEININSNNVNANMNAELDVDQFRKALAALKNEV